MCVCDHADPGQPGISLGVSLDWPKVVVFSFLSDHADFLQQVSDVAVRRLPQDASLVAVERSVADAIRRACKEFNQRHPDVIVIAHEMDPRCACSASKEKERKEKKRQTRKDKTRQGYAFRRQFNEKPSIIPGLPRSASKHCGHDWQLLRPQTVHVFTEMSIPRCRCELRNGWGTDVFLHWVGVLVL